MSYKNDGYEIIRGAISVELANFISKYFLLKKDAVEWLFENHPNVSDDGEWWCPTHGTWKDKQVLNTYSVYADYTAETLLMKLLPVMQKTTGLTLTPCYSYARVYKHGDILEKHTDRGSCEVSTTLHLGGDDWDIYLGGKQVSLKVGDMLIYQGNKIEHWRNTFKGKTCTQVFLHYNDVKGPFGKQNLLDGRPLLGLPHHCKTNFLSVQKLDLFPSPIWLCKLKIDPEYKKQIIEDIYKEKAKGKNPKRSNTGSWQSDVDLFKRPLYQKLCDMSAHTMMDIFRDADGCNYLQMWAQVSQKGDTNELHGHGGLYDLSGAIYLSVPENSGAFYFRDPRPGAMLTPAKPFGSPWYKYIDVRDDLLVLFFPFLEHGTLRGTQTTDRIMISFDVQLRGARSIQPYGFTDLK